MSSRRTKQRAEQKAEQKEERQSKAAGYDYDDVDHGVGPDTYNDEDEGRWFRKPDNGMIAGVCAGMAEYYEVSTLMARGVAVTGALFMPQIVVVAYIVGIFLLPTKRELLHGNPRDYSRKARKKAKQFRSDSRRARRQSRHQAQYFSGEETVRRSSSRRAAKRASRQQRKAASYGSKYEPQAAYASQSVDSKRVMLRKYSEKFKNMDARMRDMEQHVTSRQYDLAREIDSL